LATASAAAELGDEWWLADLASHPRFHYFAVALLAAPVALALRRRRLAFAAALVVAAQIHAIAAAPRLPSAAEAAGAPFRVASINVLWSNKRFDEFRNLVVREKPDILVLQEVALGWWDTVEGLNRTLYPHRAPGKDDEWHSDFALLSRFPILEQRLVFLPGQRFGYLEAVLDVNGRRVRIVAVHPPYPLSAGLTEINRRHFEAFVAVARRSAEPVLIVGDFNLTPYSPRFRHFLSTSGLAIVDLGWLWPRTWPSADHRMFFAMAFRGFPIDHIVASGHFAAISARTIAVPGSDHLGVAAILILRP
jgi:endonuclease/exonuclease/phosphatase (EEP) superfamily protein YafD